jgi:hypothetical protein
VRTALFRITLTSAALLPACVVFCCTSCLICLRLARFRSAGGYIHSISLGSSALAFWQRQRLRVFRLRGMYRIDCVYSHGDLFLALPQDRLRLTYVIGRKEENFSDCDKSRP